MATFYVLPPRTVLADRWNQFWQALFPGLPLQDDLPELLLSRVEECVTERPDVYIVYRDDLPEDVSIEASLRDGFGAEYGDQIVEVRWAGTYRPAPVRVTTFRLENGSEPRLLCYNHYSE